VHDLASTHYIATEGLADALMAKANAEDRQLAGEMANQFQRDARLVGRAGAWRDDDALRVQGLDLGNAEFIVAHDSDIGTELAEVLHHVVGKGVVVIQHQQHKMTNLLIFKDFTA